jgi:hypothetical protein
MEHLNNYLLRGMRGNPFVLCNSTIKNIDDLFKTISPLKLIESSSFKTFCSLSEASQKDILLNIFGLKAFRFARVKQFCESDKKISGNALETFYDLSDFNFISQEDLCSDNKSVVDQYWKKFKTKFGLKDFDQRQLLRFCDYERHFLFSVFNAPFTKKFPGKTEMKQLCFISESLREEVTKNGFVKVESVEGVEENIENLSLETDCDFKLNEDDKVISSFGYENLNTLMDSEYFCELVLDLGVDGINELY